MAKQLNQHVMTKAFRTGLTEVYKAALVGVGVELADKDIRPHIDSSATLVLTDRQLEKAQKLPGWLALSAHGNSGAITVHIKAAAEYIRANRPTLTEEERAAKRSGNGVGVGTKAEQDARRAAKSALREQLKQLHGIDLDAMAEDNAESGE